MNPEKIRFNCPACGIQLDVPAALAGVSGPCPSCQSTITAPHPQAPAPQPQQPVFPTEAPPQPQQPQQPAPPRQPVQPSAPVPPATPEAAPHPVYEEPAYQEPAVPVTPPPAESQPSQARYEPEPQPQSENVFPTVVPSPTQQPEVHPLPDDSPYASAEAHPVNELPEQRNHEGHASMQPDQRTLSAGDANSTPTKQKSRLPSLLFLIATLILMTIAVLAVLSYTGVVGLNTFKSLFSPSKTSPTIEQGLLPKENVPPQELEVKETTPTLPPLQESSQANTPPAGDGPSIEPVSEPEAVEPEEPAAEPQLPEGEDYREGETPLPEGFGTTNDPREVQKILAGFLGARSLDQRKSFLSAESTSNPKVTESILSGPIPKPTSTLFMDVLSDNEEQRTDFFYVVAWDGQNGTPSKPIAVELHKWPGSEPPRVQTEAFLEFYQQKLPRYAAAPLDRPAQFFVLGECVAKCFETEAVPDHASKATLKLGSFPNDRSPIKAYFDKKGEIFEQLKKYREGLAFKKGIPMTVTLAWSSPTSDSLARYLEVRLINSFDWHP